MHHHLEVIMPPTDDVAGVLAAIMEPFNEQPEKDKDDDGDPVDTRHAFWDYYVIGGRWAGKKRELRLGADRIKTFYEWCREADIKVNGVQMGKQTIATAEMRRQVDEKWREMFPEETGPCILFDHANDQLGLHGESSLDGDVALLKDVALTMKCGHVIIAAPSFGGDGTNYDDVEAWNGPARASYMVTDSAWNGVNHLDVKWDGTLGDAIAQHAEKMKNCREAYRIASTPGENWLVVTVDYHS